MKNNDSLESKLQSIEQRLEELSNERRTLELAREKILKLKQERMPNTPNKLTPEQKIEIFKDYFRGRVDIHSTHWKNKKGRSGYSVACENE